MACCNPISQKALKKYLSVCPRKTHGRPCSMIGESENSKWLNKPWGSWTRENVKKTEKVLDLLYSLFSKSLWSMKSKLWKDVQYDYHFIKSDKHYINV